MTTTLSPADALSLATVIVRDQISRHGPDITLRNLFSDGLHTALYGRYGHLAVLRQRVLDGHRADVDRHMQGRAWDPFALLEGETSDATRAAEAAEEAALRELLLGTDTTDQRTER